MYKLKSIEDFGNSYRVTFTPTNKEVVFDVLKHKSDILFQNLSEVADHLNCWYAESLVLIK